MSSYIIYVKGRYRILQFKEFIYITLGLRFFSLNMFITQFMTYIIGIFLVVDIG